MTKRNYKVNENGVINQTQRNQLREELMTDMEEMLKGNTNCEVNRIEEGILIEIPDDELGSIPAIISIKIKPINFDSLSAIEERKNKVADREQKAKEKEEKKKAIKK